MSFLVEFQPEFAPFKSKIGTPLAGAICIPVAKTQQYPGRIIDAPEGSASGNAQVLDGMREQGGLAFSDERLLKNLVLVHCDLNTLEKIESLQQSRSIETDKHSSAINRYQFVVPFMGLFHLKMGVLECLRRLQLPNKESRLDNHSSFKNILQMQPKNVEKFKGNPGYRLLHDAFWHETAARLLDCWRETISAHTEYKNLPEYAKAKPKAADLFDLALKLYDKFVAKEDFERRRHQLGEHRDEIFENGQLYLRDSLLYVELSHSMKHGDISRIEDTMLPLIWMSKATGKHKYAAKLWRYLMNVKGDYPPGLVHAIRMNMLCNPTGTLDGFRGQDWLIERNNYRHKHVHMSSGSNNSLEQIIKRSPLIGLFAKVHDIVESVFDISPGTSKHTRPDMTATVLKLADTMRLHDAHQFQMGRRASYHVPNSWKQGLVKIRVELAANVAANKTDLDDNEDESEMTDGVDTNNDISRRRPEAEDLEVG